MEAIHAGVSAAHILDGRIAHSLLLELFTDAGSAPRSRSPHDPGELQKLERSSVMGSYARFPVEFVRGEGARLWDAEGNEYLDFLCGISVTSLGHCHPRVVDAVREQAGRLMHDSNLFYTEPAMRLAERLSRVEPGRQGVLLQLRRGGQRGGDQARAQGAPRRRRRGRAEGPSTGARTVRCRRRRRRPSRRRSRRCVPGFRAVARDDPDALRGGGRTGAPPR